MSWHYTGYVWPFLISVLVAVLVGRYAWPRRDLPATLPFIALILTAGAWSLVSSLQVLVAGLGPKVLLANVRYVAIVTLPVAWLTFALAYTGRRQWLTPRRIAGLMAVPLITLAMVASNPLHGLMFEATSLSMAGVVPSVARVYGPWFWIHTAYSYGLIGLGALLILIDHVYSPRLYRKQATLMLIGVVAALLMNVVFLAAPSQFGHVDLTPVAFTISGVFFTWGLFRASLLDLMPVARTAIVESMPDAVIVLDTRNRVVDLNQAARQLFGQTASGIIGQPIDALTQEVDLNWPEHSALKSIAEEIVLQVEDERRHFECRISPMQHRQSEASEELVLVVLHDITDRKRAEALEVGYRHLLAMIAEGHPLPGVLDALARFTEYLASGEMLSSILLLDDAQRLRHGAAPNLPVAYVRALDGLLIGPKAVSCGVAAHLGETVIVPDITVDVRWTAYRAVALEHGLRACWSTPIFSSDGQVLGTFAMYYRTVCEPSAVELRVIEMASYLAGIAIERRRFEADLIAAKERAEEMARLKEAFLTNMSHEIRTPLTSIIGFSDILAGELEDEHQYLIQHVSKAGKRLLATLNDVLDYARLESGAIEMRADVLNVPEIARETVSVFLPQTRAKGLTLELETHVPEAYARLDRALLIRVLNNLVENALKFTDEGGVVLEVNADTDHVTVNVRDTGRGISQEFLPSIFEEFRQESTGLSRSHEGSGLGLQITKQLVERMQGTITVESRQGEGSSFAVTFPRYAA